MRALELRIPPPLVGVVIAIAMWAAESMPPLLGFPSGVRVWGGALLAVLGFGVMLGGVIAFRQAQTTINPLKPETSSALVSSGVYSFTRNPMYLGMAVLLLAWAVYLASLWSFVGPVAFALYITRFQILPEEWALEKLFGAAFQEYKKNVRRWL